MENKTAITIFIILLVIMISTTIYYNIPKKEYNFYEINCTLESVIDTCNQTIQVDSISRLGVEINQSNVNEEMLDNLCNRLNDDTWGCGIYLVKYE